MTLDKIRCSNCGKEHPKRDHNCCWIWCDCEKKICGGCGSTNVENMEMDEDDDEAQYWCCQRCGSCGLEGCAWCI